MPGINTTGLPNTSDYNLGRGIAYFATIDSSTGKPKEYRDLGNAPEFSISVETESLEHQSSRAGLKVTDKEVLISQKVSLSLTLDEVNFDNLAVLLSGTTDDTYVNPAVAGFGEYEMIASGDLVLGRWYDIVNASGVRAYDIDATKLTVDNGVDDTNLTEGTDYTVDETMGRIFFLSTAVDVAAGEEVDVTLAADAGAKGVDEVKSLTQTSVAGALKFISENPAASDTKTEFQFHQVSLKAEGDFSLIGDEFSQMQFTGVAESNVLADADSPTLTIRTLQAS